jgi:hypothetical protein
MIKIFARTHMMEKPIPLSMFCKNPLSRHQPVIHMRTSILSLAPPFHLRVNKIIKVWLIEKPHVPDHSSS